MNWYQLLKIADYQDEWSDQIEQLSKGNPYPFSAWFGENGRTYIPFSQVAEGQEYDPEVIGVLNDNNCQVIDYRGGYCQQGNRQFRIGKFIERIKKQEIQKLQQQDAQGQIYDLQREINAVIEFYDDILNQFVNSSFRMQKGQDQFQVVISQNPHDVAQMSTDRSWESCMTLGSGGHHEDVFCEVQRGGLVAYLINANDLDITQPLARIHIRRFDNRQGQSIAISERSIYGNEIAGFYEAVKGWLDQQQGDIQSGMYQRIGGEYSDTFGKDMLVTPEDQENILQWFRQQDPNAQWSEWILVDELYRDAMELEDRMSREEFSDIFSDEGDKFNTEEEGKEALMLAKERDSDYDRDVLDDYLDNDDPDWEKWSDIDEETGEYLKERFVLKEVPHDKRSEMTNHAAKAILAAPKGEYSSEVIQELKEFYFGKSRGIGSSPRLEFLKKYPEYLNKEDVESLDDSDSLDFIQSLPEDQREPYTQQWIQSIEGVLDNPELLIDDEVRERRNDVETKPQYNDNPEKARKSLQYSVDLKIYVNIYDQIFKPLDVIAKQLPETLIRKLVNFVSNLDKIGMKEEEIITPIPGHMANYWLRTQTGLAHLFSMKRADTPAVQGFYESLLPYWGDRMNFMKNPSHVNLDTLGNAIAWLGENGRQFIPFMQNQLVQSQQESNSMAQQLAGYENPGDHKAQRMESEIEHYKKDVEKYLFIIDSLESGTGRSKKYKFFSRNWYKQSVRGSC